MLAATRQTPHRRLRCKPLGSRSTYYENWGSAWNSRVSATAIRRCRQRRNRNAAKGPQTPQDRPLTAVRRDALRHRADWPVNADSGWQDYADSRQQAPEPWDGGRLDYLPKGQIDPAMPLCPWRNQVRTRRRRALGRRESRLGLQACWPRSCAVPSPAESCWEPCVRAFVFV